MERREEGEGVNEDRSLGDSFQTEEWVLVTDYRMIAVERIEFGISPQASAMKKSWIGVSHSS